MRGFFEIIAFFVVIYILHLLLNLLSGSIGDPPINLNPVKLYSPTSIERIDYTINAESLAKEFEDNAVRAMNKYKGKIINISGTIKDFDTSLNGSPIIILKGYKYKDIILKFTIESNNNVAKYNKGERFSSEFKIDRDWGDLYLNRCL